MISLLKCIDKESCIYGLSKQIATLKDIPESTVLLTGLAIFSSIACRKYHVVYEDGKILPIGLYALMEHPPGTGKSPTIELFKEPFYDIYNQLDCSDITLFISNTTPEALEERLNKTQGFFSAVSAEQGLLNSLFGLAYKDSKGSMHNNDVVLNGFDGGNHSSFRVSRGGYTGRVSGGICTFSQPGTIKKILELSEGTGLADRFLMLSEDSFLGKRDHLTDKPIINGDYYTYRKRCSFAKSVFSNPQILKKTVQLAFSKESYLSLRKLKASIEPKLADGKEYSNSFIRGAAAKTSMHAMKLAANLFLLSNDTSGVDVNFSADIPHKYTLEGIAIAETLLENIVQLANTIGYMGYEAEESAIISYYSKRNKTKILYRELYNSLRTTKPFSEMSGDKPEAIKKVLHKMINDGKLLITQDNYYQLV
jgi:hypothetical protein